MKIVKYGEWLHFKERFDYFWFWCGHKMKKPVPLKHLLPLPKRPESLLFGNINFMQSSLLFYKRKAEHICKIGLKTAILHFLFRLLLSQENKKRKTLYIVRKTRLTFHWVRSLFCTVRKALRIHTGTKSANSSLNCKLLFLNAIQTFQNFDYFSEHIWITKGLFIHFLSALQEMSIFCVLILTAAQLERITLCTFWHAISDNGY